MRGNAKESAISAILILIFVALSISNWLKRDKPPIEDNPILSAIFILIGSIGVLMFSYWAYRDYKIKE